MFLTAQNIVHYLLAAGLVSPRDVVDENYRLVEIGRRNRNFKISRPKSSSLFVKQLPMVHAETIGSLRREAAATQVAHHTEAGSLLRRIMPVLLRFDPHRHVLVYEALENAQTLNELHSREPQPPVAIARELGGMMADYHVETATLSTDSRVADAVAVLPRMAPWVFTIAINPEAVIPNMSPASRQVVATIRTMPDMMSALQELDRNWRRLCLIHGDIKWDNFLVTTTVDGERRLRLIDWELCDIGDPLWDVACILEAYLQLWMMKLPSGPAPADTAAMIRAASVPLATIYPAIRAFWDSYVERSGIERASVVHALHRVAQLVGARLVLFTFELLPKAQAMDSHADLAVQLARYFVVNPLAAASDLLGLTPPAASVPFARVPS